ncbi:oxidoreductase [Polyangium aurulentum]|uniref:oxidoreductase n=1 Tax=Polyangium aurulentum TaxID=2567896 RepID=UPI0010AE1412|nr:oxidoreductase [Polyangium aurulentum]UQA59485.1 SDR family NAD(P)-dependent oxidoreductase [Polyangium aurulentum]
MAQAAKIWFVTGISRGLGKAIAEAALERGDVVIGTTRDGTSDIATQSGRLHVLPLDVTQREAARATVAAAHALHGRLDVVVNNAGFGLLGAVEEATDEETRDVFAVNFFGTLHVTQAALPLLRAQGHGHIVNITSIAGLAPMAGSGLYAAAKFAVEGMSQSLAEEVRPLGIRVTIVEPGAFRTDFLSDRSIRHTGSKIEAYDQTSGKAARHLAEIAGKQLGDPVLGARAILRAVDAPVPPLHLVLGSDALRRTRVKIEQLSRELDAWQDVATSTDFSGTA